MTDTTNALEVMSVWFDSDSDVIGRELTANEHDDLTDEQVVEAIKNADCYIIVSCNKFRDRCYINLKTADDELDDESFMIDPSLPSMRKLLRAIDNEHHAIVRAEDGQFTLVYEEDNARAEAEVELNDDGSWKLVKVFEDDEE